MHMALPRLLRLGGMPRTVLLAISLHRRWRNWLGCDLPGGKAPIRGAIDDGSWLTDRLTVSQWRPNGVLGLCGLVIVSGFVPADELVIGLRCRSSYKRVYHHSYRGPMSQQTWDWNSQGWLVDWWTDQPRTDGVFFNVRNGEYDNSMPRCWPKGWQKQNLRKMLIHSLPKVSTQMLQNINHNRNGVKIWVDNGGQQGYGARSHQAWTLKGAWLVRLHCAWKDWFVSTQQWLAASLSAGNSVTSASVIGSDLAWLSRLLVQIASEWMLERVIEGVNEWASATVDDPLLVPDPCSFQTCFGNRQPDWLSTSSQLGGYVLGICWHWWGLHKEDEHRSMRDCTNRFTNKLNSVRMA